MSLVPYIDGCLTPTQGTHALVVQTNLLVTLQKTVTAAVTSTKNVTLYLRGSDPLAGPPVWRVAEELPSWITLQVEQATIQLPSIDLGTSRLKGNWELELPVSASPSGLAERPAPLSQPRS